MPGSTLNPSSVGISLAALMADSFGMAGQVFGALAASAAVMDLKLGSAATLFRAPIGPAFAAEVCSRSRWFTSFSTSTKSGAGNWYFGLAIGFTVTAAAFAVGNIPGGAFNPAVAIGACMIGMLSWSAIWLYSSRNTSQVG